MPRSFLNTFAAKDSRKTGNLDTDRDTGNPVQENVAIAQEAHFTFCKPL